MLTSVHKVVKKLDFFLLFSNQFLLVNIQYGKSEREKYSIRNLEGKTLKLVSRNTFPHCDGCRLFQNSKLPSEVIEENKRGISALVKGI